MHDLCLCPEVTTALSKICGIPILPHTIPHQLGHLNYNPVVTGENIDKWHVDTLRIDYVMFVTDPKSVECGELQYHKGTKEDFLANRKAGNPLDETKVASPAIPEPGDAILQQGIMVVHRAKGLSAPGKRIAMMNGYMPQDIRFPDFSRYDQLVQVDPPHIAASEYARHVQWMARERLDADLAEFAFSDDKAGMADRFAFHAQMMDTTATQLRTTYDGVEHFGDG
ncbi:MAG: hypothetical protein ACJAXK_000163 [Yoonia sp.]